MIEIRSVAEIEPIITRIRSAADLAVQRLRDLSTRDGLDVLRILKFLKFEAKVEVIAVEHVHAMLDAALADDLPLLPCLVFGFFAGVRPEDELMSLEWRDLDQTDGC